MVLPGRIWPLMLRRAGNLPESLSAPSAPAVECLCRSLARPKGRALWFSSYIQTHLERDVRAIVNIRDLATFRRFLALPNFENFGERLIKSPKVHMADPGLPCRLLGITIDAERRGQIGSVEDSSVPAVQQSHAG